MNPYLGVVVISDIVRTNDGFPIRRFCMYHLGFYPYILESGKGAEC